jgi:hypothetical protein
VPPVLCKQKIFCGTYPQIGKIYITDCCYWLFQIICCFGYFESNIFVKKCKWAFIHYLFSRLNPVAFSSAGKLLSLLLLFLLLFLLGVTFSYLCTIATDFCGHLPSLPWYNFTQKLTVLLPCTLLPSSWNLILELLFLFVVDNSGNFELLYKHDNDRAKQLKTRKLQFLIETLAANLPVFWIKISYVFPSCIKVRQLVSRDTLMDFKRTWRRTA